MNRRALVLIGLGALGVLACGVSFVAGGEAFRQGRFHVARELLDAARQPVTGIRARFLAPEAPVLAVDMKFKHLRRIEQDREAALSAGKLTKTTTVPATLRAEERTYAVKMRLKGHALDHLLGNKWSYRIDLSGSDRLWGMRGFALQHPGRRGFEREWLFHRHLQVEGILGLRYRFVRLVFNGDDLGLFALEERFAKQLLETQGRREGPIVKFDDTARLERIVRGSGADLISGDYTTNGVASFESKRLAASPTLSTQRDAAMQLLWSFAQGDLTASEVFKVAQLGRYMAICELYGAWHALAYHNVRFAYDPVAARLEPIGYDANSAVGSSARDLHALAMPWVASAVEDPALARVYTAELMRLTDPSYLNGVRDELEDAFDKAVLLLNREWPINSETVWRSIADRQLRIRNVITVTRLVRGRVFPAPDGLHEIEIINNLRLPVELRALHTDDAEVPLDGQVLPGTGKGETGAPWRRLERLGVAVDGAVSVECRMLGTEEWHRVELTSYQRSLGPDGPRPAAPDVAEALAHHPFLALCDEPNRLRIDPGDWRVAGDLVLPHGYGLTIAAGTTLRFEPAAALVATGPLIITGTAAQPVRLIPREHSFAGVLVGNASLSRWSHVEVTSTTGIDRDGWMTTGGVTFDHTDAYLVDCRFDRSRGEDALNVIGAETQLLRTTFSECSSDAFDGDFVTGRILQCVFQDIAGDAIDVSGSTMSVHDVEIRSVADKGISVGERSSLEISSVVIRGAGIGVASKDYSTLDGVDIEIIDCRVGLAAYLKKPEYGPASITTERVALLDVDTRFLVQTGSAITLNGHACPTRDFDIDKLYAADGS